MTDPAGIPALQDAIRHVHGCESEHVETVHVHEKTPDGRETVWTGGGEVFALLGHPTSARCHVWSESIPAGKRRFFAALRVGKVDQYRPAEVRPGVQGEMCARIRHVLFRLASDEQSSSSRNKT